MTNNNGATPEQLNALSKPMPKRLIKRATVKGTTIDYVTARTVMNWLDHSVGRENWQTSYALIKASDPMTVECTLSIRANGEWVGKADVGTESTWSPEKGAYSNALKRAGAAWGIARELYGEGNVHETDDAPPPPSIADVSAEPPEENDELRAQLLSSAKLFDPEKWHELVLHFVSAGFASNPHHAHKRLRKVYGLAHDAAWINVVANQNEAHLTVGELAAEFEGCIEANRANQPDADAQA